LQGAEGRRLPPDEKVQDFLRKRVDDFLRILDGEVGQRPFIIGDRPTVADLSLCGYLSFPVEESGYDLAARFPDVAGWLQRIAALPGWKSPYELLPGQQLKRYV
jgi:glutathione S-transferase